MILYLAVTADELELPLYVADSAKELAKHFGVSTNVVLSSISHDKNGKKKGRKFIRIKVD